MKDRKLAVRYARALFGVFPDAAQNEAISTFLTRVGESISSSRDIRERLFNPAVPRAKRTAIFTDLVQRAGLPQGVSNFFKILVDNHRIPALPAIAAVFAELREEAAGIVPVELTTAAPLDDSQRARAKSAAEKLTGRNVRLTYKIQPGVLGGAVTRIGSTIYDGSLRTQLNQLQRRMAQE